jgi:glycosyltransferase involved in cell wall biosynthesis
MNISVVIPYYNESLTLEKTLNALANQTLKPFEIIFVDSGSNDHSPSVIKGFIKKHHIKNIILLTSGEMSPSTSINLGVKKSSSDLVAYIDCGLEIPLDWLESSLNLMEKSNADIISPQIYTMGKELIDKAFVSHTYGYDYYRPCFTGSLMKKILIEKVNYFLPNARASYDIDFIKKINTLNAKRIINRESALKYFGTNYSRSFISGIWKISAYSENGWRVKGDIKPYFYLTTLLILLVGLYLEYGMMILISYFLIRGYFIPLFKSSRNIWKEFKLFFILPVAGFVIDFSRIAGYLFIHKIVSLKWE